MLPSLEEATDESETRTAESLLDMLLHAAKTEDKEVAEKITTWLAERLRDKAISVKIKTLKLVDQLYQQGNADYKLATKRFCLADVAALTAFITAPHKHHGDKPQNLVRSLASKMSRTLEAAPDEARQDLVASATIPPHGTVRDGMNVHPNKPGHLMMIFDNTVRML